MSNNKKSATINNLKLSVLLLIFFAVVFNTFPLFHQKNSFSGEYSYCPLQKTWVNRNEATQSTRQNPLDEICMSNGKKNVLALQISLKIAFAIDEKGIFETLRNGVKVLDKYRQPENLPNQHLTSIRHTLVF